MSDLKDSNSIQGKDNLSEGAVPTNLSGSLIQKLGSEWVKIEKGLTLTNLPIVDISPTETKINSSQNNNNQKDE